MQEDQSKLDAWVALMSVYTAHIRKFESMLRSEHGLSAAQFEILRRLHADGRQPLRMSDLGRAILYGSGATTNVVRRLEERGLVTRSQDEDDARGVRVRLTPLGEELIVEARRKHHAAVAETMPGFEDDAERDAVIGYLRRARGDEVPTVAFIPSPRQGG